MTQSYISRIIATEIRILKLSKFENQLNDTVEIGPLYFPMRQGDHQKRTLNL